MKSKDAIRLMMEKDPFGERPVYVEVITEEGKLLVAIGSVARGKIFPNPTSVRQVEAIVLQQDPKVQPIIPFKPRIIK